MKEIFKNCIKNQKNAKKWKLFSLCDRRRMPRIKYLKYLIVCLLVQKNQKNHENVLTIEYFCAKIGNVKGFFTKYENDFQNYRKFSQKSTEKWKLFPKWRKFSSKPFDENVLFGRLVKNKMRIYALGVRLPPGDNARKEAVYWTGPYYRPSSCITRWVSLNAGSLTGYFLTPARCFRIRYPIWPLCANRQRQR